MKKLSVLSAFIVSASLLASPVMVMAADATQTPIEKLISEMADKPEQHQAISQYYKDKAETAKKELAQHQQMRKAYLVGYGKNQFASDSMRKHCDNLVKLDEALIKEYEAMATEHDATSAKKP